MLSQNPNETETLSLIDTVIKPYVDLKRKELKLQPTQKALLIWDVFKGQKTDKVLSKLASLNIEVVSVPANMTHFFQPLDLTVNGEAKRFMKDQFTMWYSAEIQKQMEATGNDDNIEVDLRLSVLKPLHATWLVSLYNHLMKGWEKAGVAGVARGETSLPSEDPFKDIDSAPQ